MTVVRVVGLLVCGATLGVAGLAAWFVWYMNRNGGLFR